MGDMHCDTDVRISDGGQLSYAMRSCKLIPIHLVATHGHRIRHLDLSYNIISNLSGIELFPELEELILDGNDLCDDSLASLGYLPRLRVLSLNRNKLRDLELIVKCLSARTPSLTYLSLLANPACPDRLISTSEELDDSDYRRYRLFVLYNLPTLRFLDHRVATDAEKSESIRKSAFLKTVRLDPDDVIEQRSFHEDDEEDEQRPQYSPLPPTIYRTYPRKQIYGKAEYRITTDRHGRPKDSEGNVYIHNKDL